LSHNEINFIPEIGCAADYLSNPAAQAQIKEYERRIDRLVYKLYGLTEEEIVVVEGCK
jgi:hypothetical protein